MVKLPDVQQPYWLSNTSKPAYPALDRDMAVDVAIIGGGITGLTAAYLLKQAGRTVAVLEKHRLGSGTTGGTTGKVTSQHGLIYADLQKKHGRKTAELYAHANQAAINQIEDIIKLEKIDCAWQRQDNYIYTTDQAQIEKFKAEAKAAKSLGLPASFVTSSPLPLAIKAAVKFSDQAYFNSYKYILGLAKAVDGNGSYVFENSQVTTIKDGQPAIVKTKAGTIKAHNIIVATKIPTSPLIARLTYGFLEYPHTSYIVAGKYAAGLPGMYISPDEGQYSILPVSDDHKQLLLIGGENHIPGLGRSKHRQTKLAKYAQRHFGIKKIDYRWKAMDYITYDYLPAVGKVYPWSKHLYTATGYKKWGLTTSFVAASILRDIILGRPNDLAAALKPSRFKPLVSAPAIAYKWFTKPKIAARSLGAVLAIVGILGLTHWLAPLDEHGTRQLFGLFEVDTPHNLVHLGSGALALLAGSKQKPAMFFLRAFGAIYGLVAIVGLAQDSTVLGLFHVNLADNFLHIGIATLSLWLGFKHNR